jgi:outer membrane protein insertion porin family
LRYRLEIREVSPRDGASPSIAAEKGETSLSEISTSINIDTTNSNIAPSEGYNVSIATAFAGISGDKKFIRIDNSGNYYKSFNDETIIIGFGYNLGFIEGIDQNILVSDRYFLGGTKFRGFEQSGIGPRDKNSKDSLGGNIFYTGTIQASFGIGLPPELGVKGNWFTTFGSLFGVDNATVSYHDDSSIRMSTGIGISWASPFGPISVTISEAILKESYDKTETVSFGIGSKF